MFPLRDNVPSRSFPAVTLLLIALNVVVYLLQSHLPPRLEEQFLHLYGVVPRRLLQPDWAAAHGYPDGAWLTLLSYMFLHGGWFHLISNVWALWIFGDNVEDRLGHLRYLLHYLFWGLAAMLLQLLLDPAGTLPTVGASGAIAGVMGAYFRFFPLARITVLIPILFYPLFLAVPAVVYLFIWIASQVLNGTASLLMGQAGVGGVAFWAHVGGFVAGLLFGQGVRRRRWAG